jgi:S-adenosylmethionine uptake transporter
MKVNIIRTTTALANGDGQTPVQGMLLMVLAMIMVPGIDVFAKLLTSSISAGQISWFRFVIQAALFTPIVIYYRLYHIKKGTITLHALRGIMLAVATIFFFTALIKLSIAEAVAIFFVEPLILTLLSALFLGEAIRARRIIAVIVGFIGAIIIIRPTFISVGAAALYPLGAAVCFALYVIFTRQLTSTHPFQLQWVGGVSAAIFMTIALIIGDLAGWSVLTSGLPQGKAVIWVLCLGIVATVGHLMLVLALKRAPVSLLAPFQYIEIISATIFGYLVFGDLLDLPAIVGVLIIISSGLYVFHREAVQKTPGKH